MPKNLTSKDYQDLLGVISLTHSLPDRKTVLKAVHAKLEKWIGITGLVFTPNHNSEEGLLSCKSFFVFHPSDEFGKDGNYYYNLSDLCIKNKKCLETPDFIFILKDVVPGRCSQTNETCPTSKSIIPINYEIKCRLSYHGILIRDAGLHRSSNYSPFSNRELGIIQHFLPHLSQTLHRNGETELKLSSPKKKNTELAEKFSSFGLTPRQKEISLYIVQGLTNKAIAQKLFINEQTVKDHLGDIFQKIKVRSRTELIAKVLELNIRE